MPVQRGGDPFRPLKPSAIGVERRCHPRPSQNRLLDGRLLPACRCIHDRGIVIGNEVAGVGQHDIPGRIAEHDRKAVWKDLGERKVPWHGIGLHRIGRPDSMIGNPGRQRQPAVVTVALSQHGRFGPGAGQLPQRIQQPVQPVFHLLFRCDIGDIPADRCVQLGNQQPCFCQGCIQSIGDTPSQQRIERTAGDGQG